MAKNFENLMKDLQSDSALLKEFQDAKLSYADVDGIIAFAAKKGYTVTADDIKSYTDSMKTGKELSADELAKVAGGGLVFDLVLCNVYIACNYYMD